MKDKKINNPVILVAPMDWGLGHTTRCIPIITSLLARNCSVIIAASGPGRILLQKEFPGLLCLDLRGYDIHYSRKRSRLPFTLFAQFPKLISTIYTEHRWLKKIVTQYSIAAVISDNRMGMFHRSIPCIYLTHQLNIKTGNRFTERIAQKTHYWFINKFSQCWVPDTPDENNLAGELSHPVNMPHVPVKYMGPLSRFKNYSTEKKYDVAFILSGPEPQRTIFEELILKELSGYGIRAVLVRGITDPVITKETDSPYLKIHNSLGQEQLNRIILESECVIGRCGYSTIMDLVKLHKKALLVPTPGQTEQEYLAEYLSGKKIFCSAVQEDFSLPEALKALDGFSFSLPAVKQNNFESVLEDFLKSLSRN
ncbi:MAG TPA: glycosyltransferase [Ferruginibacter sp.]|nr:glycosyltransferase [Ferruginibacter sp.]